MHPKSQTNEICGNTMQTLRKTDFFYKLKFQQDMKQKVLFAFHYNYIDLHDKWSRMPNTICRESFYPLQPSVAYLYPLKTSKNLQVF